MENQNSAWSESIKAMCDLSECSIKDIETKAEALEKKFKDASDSMKCRMEYMQCACRSSEEIIPQYEAFRQKEEAFERAYQGFIDWMTLLKNC